jgi:hypothetical protein
MESQENIYDEAVAHYEQEAAVIRGKAAKIRQKKQIEPPSDKAVNSTQPSTS